MTQRNFWHKEVTTNYPIYKISLGVRANKKIIQNFMLHKFQIHMIYHDQLNIIKYFHETLWCRRACVICVWPKTCQQQIWNTNTDQTPRFVSNCGNCAYFIGARGQFLSLGRVWRWRYAKWGISRPHPLHPCRCCYPLDTGDPHTGKFGKVKIFIIMNVFQVVLNLYGVLLTWILDCRFWIFILKICASKNR